MLSLLRFIRAPLVIFALLALCTLAALDLSGSGDRDDASIAHAATAIGEFSDTNALVQMHDGVVPQGEPIDFAQFCGLIAFVAMTMIAGFVHIDEINMPTLVEIVLLCLIPVGEGGAQPQAGVAALLPVRVEGDSPWVDVEGELLYTTPGTLTGEGMGTVAGHPNVKAVIDATIDGQGNIEGTYTLGPDGELPGGEAAVYEINGQFGSGTPTPSATPAPTASPTASAGPTASASPVATPTGSPTEPPEGQQVVWGDANCSGEANPIDSLLTLRNDAGLDANTGDCPDLGTEVDVLNASLHIWGDVDCSDEANPIDSLKILRFDAGLSVSQGGGCPAMGSQVQIAVP